MTATMTAYQAPLVELKAVKILQERSEETLCFNANVYVNGKKAGTAGNSGHGGPNEVRWTDKAAKDLVDEYRSKLKPAESDHNDEGLDYCEDFFFNTLIYHHDEVAHYKRAVGNKICLFETAEDQKKKRMQSYTRIKASDPQAAEFIAKEKKTVHLIFTKVDFMEAFGLTARPTFELIED